jgi:TolB-like protein/two-component SAPR family response regulator
MPRGSNAALRLRVLGEFSLGTDGKDVAVPGQRCRALLAFLACHPGKPQSREKLAALLWGERFDEQARQSLRQALAALRRILGDAVVAADRNEVELRNGFSSDVGEFLVLLASRQPSQLRQAIALYDGELLSGFNLRQPSFADWLAGERARLRDLALGALETLMDGAGEAPADLITLAQRAISLDPYREQAHRHLMRSLALAGRRNEALTHYRQLVGTLQADLGVQPDAATRSLFEALRTGSPVDSRSAAGGSTGTVPAATDKPAIAVLPFENIGGDASMDRLADGITADIITDLARFRGLDVIARNSTAVYKGKSVDMRQIGRELDVRYVVEGSIQRRGEQIRVTAQLVDAATGASLWSERWDRPDRDVFATQTEVAVQVAATLGGMGGSAVITGEEIRRARRRPPASLTAYDYYLLANEGRTHFTRESIFGGIEAATKAISLDPALGRAYVARAWLNYISAHYGVELEAAMEGMAADAQRALALDPHDAEARVAFAFYLSGRGRFTESEAQIRTALQANPANAQVLVVASAMQAVNGKPEEAVELADKVMRLDPWMTAENLNCVKDAYYYGRRFEDVIAVVSRIPLNARGKGARLLLTLSYALLGREKEMAQARAELLAAYPSISAELLLNQDWVYARTQEENFLLEGFRAAGLPLCASAADLAGIGNARRLPECAAPG